MREANIVKFSRPRSHSRQRLALPVVFSWRNPEGTPQQGTGFTQDISAKGIFLVTRTELPLGTPIEFETFLPAVSQATTGLRMQGKGRVLRVEPKGTLWQGVATVSTRVSLLNIERRFSRQPLEVPLLFSWKDDKGRRHRGTGFARNLSPGGFYLVTRDRPPIAHSIEFEALLPSLGPNAPCLRLQGVANTLRVEREAGNNGDKWQGIAAATDNFVLREME